jgi:hypothetical protein
MGVEKPQSGERQQFDCPLERDVFPSPFHILASVCTKFDSAANPEKRGILFGIVLVHRERETGIDFGSRQVFAAVGYDLGCKVPFTGARGFIVFPSISMNLVSIGIDHGD